MNRKQVAIGFGVGLVVCVALVLWYLFSLGGGKVAAISPPEHWGKKIKLRSHPDWGDEIYLEIESYVPPLKRSDMDKVKSSEQWVTAYLSNRDFRTIGYDELAALSTRSALLDKGVETREKFETRVKSVASYYKTHPERVAPNKAVLWRTSIEIRGQRYMLICAVDEDSLSGVSESGGFKKLTLLKMEERWKFAGPTELKDSGLSGFPWDDKSKVELILANRCATYEDQRIIPCELSE